MKKTIKCHEDNSPLEKMNKTPGLLLLIRMVRVGDLDLDQDDRSDAIKRLSRVSDVPITNEDIRNAVQFFDECNDAFELVEVRS